MDCGGEQQHHTMCCRTVQLASVPAMRVAAAMQPFNAVAFVGDGVYQGAKDFSYLAAATAGACCIAAIVMVTGDGSLVHVWIALASLQAGRGLAVSLRWLGFCPGGFGPSPLLGSADGAVNTALLDEVGDNDADSP
jgi:O-antigen/teichoic acid export membrane protein